MIDLFARLCQSRVIKRHLPNLIIDSVITELVEEDVEASGVDDELEDISIFFILLKEVILNQNKMSEYLEPYVILLYIFCGTRDKVSSSYCFKSLKL